MMMECVCVCVCARAQGRPFWLEAGERDHLGFRRAWVACDAMFFGGGGGGVPGMEFLRAARLEPGVIGLCPRFAFGLGQALVVGVYGTSTPPPRGRRGGAYSVALFFDSMLTSKVGQT
ncbi:hypothetical protein LY78DRAFT_348638 [Colletotrichum sublineola]|nr:hypothetical protein LY78DRAFT_348638 [Colletotrichum sublineola]